MSDYVTGIQARKMLCVTAQTLRNWDKKVKIHTVRTPSNQRLYYLPDIKNILGCYSHSNKAQKVCYIRVSSKHQLDDLERQRDFFRHQYPNHHIIQDIASGLNWKRKGLQTILELAMSGKLTEVVVAHRDRLCRFAFELIEWILAKNGTAIHVLDQTEHASKDTELAQDIMSIVHVYSCRQMGRRRYNSKKDQTISQRKTENNLETMDWDNSICI